MKYITSKKRLILLIVLVVLIAGVAYFTYYVSDLYSHADSTALAALSSTGSYNVVDNSNSITFTPTVNKSSIGIIFYPGGFSSTRIIFSYSI